MVFYQSRLILPLLLMIFLSHYRVLSLFTSKSEGMTQVAKTRTEQADINIFTVASGLLYEVSSHSPSTKLAAFNNSPLLAIRFHHDS